MRTLLKNGTIVNVFTGGLERQNLLLEGEKIAGIGDYSEADADITRDVSGRYLCPGFIDGHIHIESTMLIPAEFARACLPHGTTTVVADPHEIANVCGSGGISYLLQASEGLPLTFYFMLPSCVPASPFDEAGARLSAAELAPFYAHPRVLGLGEVMDYPGVIAGDRALLEKINAALERGLTVNGHAPLLTGRELDRYIAAGIYDDHECSTAAEGMERIRKGQRVMIRQGTAAQNLAALLPLFDEPWAHRCLLVTDDRHPGELLHRGHMDSLIREAAKAGKDPVTAIRMATLFAAEAFGLRGVGGIAPGYTADLLVLDGLESAAVCDVYQKGRLVVENGSLLGFAPPQVSPALQQCVKNTCRGKRRTAEDFHLAAQGERSCRVIKLTPGQLLTEEWITRLDFDRENGVSVERDILKIALVERHGGSGQIGLGFISGIGLRRGAIASTVAHDSHNLIVIGTNERDMAAAANRLLEMGGGCIALDGETSVELCLPVAGLMSEASAGDVAAQYDALLEQAYALGILQGSEPFMTMAFMALPVIPHLKLTTGGLIDVDRQKTADLFAE